MRDQPTNGNVTSSANAVTTTFEVHQLRTLDMQIVSGFILYDVIQFASITRETDNQ